MTYEECLSIRRLTVRPFVLDEIIGDIGGLMKALAEDAIDIINLKITKVGGLTKARQMRDLCVANGTPMTIEDTGGGDIVTADNRASRPLDARTISALPRPTSIPTSPSLSPMAHPGVRKAS